MLNINDVQCSPPRCRVLPICILPQGFPSSAVSTGRSVPCLRKICHPGTVKTSQGRLQELRQMRSARLGNWHIAMTAACGARVRVNLYRSAGDIAIAVRILNDRIPAIEELGLPPVAETLPDYPNGIILVTGETGSGKSTALASVLNRINQTRYEHIITLEDPIEYVYQPDKCVINQREIGKDTESYDDGLRAILREDPDVILIGEMRDLSTD